MEYKPTDMQRRAKHEWYVQETLAPHLLIIRYIRQHLQPCGAVDTHTTLSIYRLLMTSLSARQETRYFFIGWLVIAVHTHSQGKVGYN
jgi:hypothetical protein